MADNNLARNRNDGPDFFADGDPLAELARIVGFDERPTTPVVAPVPANAPASAYNPQRRDPVFNLEDELLREFEQYDTPRTDPIGDIPLDEPQSHEPAAFDPPLRDRTEPQFDAAPAEVAPVDSWAPEVYEPAPSSYDASAYEASSHVEPVADRAEPARSFEPAPVEPGPQAGAAEDLTFDLAAELESSFGNEAQDVPQVPVLAQAVEAAPVEPAAVRGKNAYTPGFRMPLANFNLNGGVKPISPVIAPVEPVASEPVASVAPVSGLAADVMPAQKSVEAMPSWDLPFVKADAVPAVDSTLTPQILPQLGAAEPIAGPAVKPVSEMPNPVAPNFAGEQASVKPSEKFSALDELIYDVGRFPVAQKAVSQPVAPSIAAVAAPAAPVVQTQTYQIPLDRPHAPAAEPVVSAPAAKAPVAVAPPAATAEDPLDFDPFADDAFELALDDLELDLADIVVQENSRPQAAPAAPIQAKSAQPAYSAQPVQAAAAYVTPVAAAYEEPAELAEADLPFDPALIADSEDHPEAIAELDVPALPAEEPEEEPAYTPEYDLDIDAELAALLVDPANNAQSSHAQPSAREQAPAAAVAHARPVETRNDQRSVHADLDDFEKALEEDFRRSLATPLPANDYEQDAGYAGEFEDEGRRRSARAWALPLAFVGAVALFGGGAYALLGGGMSRVVSGGEPVVIAADKDPIKVVPENPGGKTVPNQDKAVYDRVAGAAPQTPKQQSLISSDEQPVDVVQKTLMPETLPLEGENDIEPTDVGETQDPRLLPQQGGQQQVAANGQQDPVTVAPRRVKTMIVRPDGKLVEQEIASPVPALAAPSSEKMPAASVKTPEVAALATASAPAAHAAAPASLQQTSASPSDIMPVSAAASPMPAVETPASASVAKAPVPTTRPSQQPVNVVAAVSDRGAVRAPAPAATAPVAAQPVSASPAQVASVGDGGYVIQIASLPSQADAQKSYQNLSSKFGGVIGGRGVDIKAAEIAGKGTFYRVRIPAGSKTDAVALCEKYRAAGGTCLVAK